MRSDAGCSVMRTILFLGLVFHGHDGLKLIGYQAGIIRHQAVTIRPELVEDIFMGPQDSHVFDLGQGFHRIDPKRSDGDGVEIKLSRTESPIKPKALIASSLTPVSLSCSSRFISGRTARTSPIFPSRSAAASRTSQSSSSRYSSRISTLGRPIPRRSMTVAILASSRSLAPSTSRSALNVASMRSDGT